MILMMSITGVLPRLQVQVYSGATNQVKKSISRFHQSAYSGCFRNDGKLLAAGSEEGVVKVGDAWLVYFCCDHLYHQVFDAGSRAVLRQFKGHTK